MAITSFDSIQDIVNGCLEAAIEAADVIKLSESVKMTRGSARLSLLGSEPKFAKLPKFYGMKGWAAILSVDLRDSSNRAVRVGARNTYVTMHTYLPTMAAVVGKADGRVVGLRGDGLFACFGLTELRGTGTEVTPEVGGKAVKDAANCGKAMIEAVNEAINPALARAKIPAGLEVGIGIDTGDIVVTRIGLEDVEEITAYGPAVNHACKLRAHNAVVISNRAYQIFPTSKGGRLTFQKSGNNWRVDYPRDMWMLSRAG